MIKNIIQSLFTKGLVALINFLVLILSSRYLGVSSRGEISIFILNISLIQIINEVFTGYSLVHFVPKFNLRRLLVEGLIFTLIICSLANTLLVFLNKQVQGYEWLGYLISLLVVINTFNCILLLGQQNMKMFNFLSILQPLLLLIGIAGFILWAHVYTFEAYIFPLLISFSLACVISSVITWKFPRWKLSSTNYNRKQIVVSGLLFQASLLMFIFCNRFSYYLLPNRASVGLYSSAVVIMESVLIIANGLGPVLLSKLANDANRRDGAELCLTFCKLSFILSLIAVVVILSLPEGFYISLLGVGFTGIKQLLLYYAPVVLMASLFLPLTNYFIALGKQKTVVYSYALGFIASVILAPLFINWYGTPGAAFNASAVYTIITFSLFTIFLKQNKISPYTVFSFKNIYLKLKTIVE